jgi:hypothetical protein
MVIVMVIVIVIVMVMVIDGDGEIPRDFTIPSVTIVSMVPLAITGEIVL